MTWIILKYLLAGFVGAVVMLAISHVWRGWREIERLTRDE